MPARVAPAQLIVTARQRAMQAVNTELIELHWQVGAYISRKIEAAEWGDGVVAQLAMHLERTQPGLRGFTRRSLFRMRQFYEAYRGDEKVSAPLRQIHPQALDVFKDAYVIEFLALERGHAETDLHGGLLHKLRDFLIELGREFCFVGSQYPLQVGGRDFALDLLFFHRGLNCLVAIELKVGRFEPEYLGKMDFYLEALGRNVRKPHENPALGVLLCASKEDEIVEYALNRSLSPALIAEYHTQLPDKKLLQAKLQEFYALNTEGVE
ncbi:PDDEXK nuclease domain-containing protein [Pseudomonas sp. IT-P291]|uniref:PDDEXK nuclease domain-containing protein n=1 Tax=Pseudomonas sp. IT-P291 TaxID=3026448 RepID=UPI0039E1D964